MRTTPLALLTALLLAPACMPAPPDAPAPTASPATLARVSDAPASTVGGIESIEYAGTGCDPAGVATSISDDKQASTSIFSAFVAEAGPGADPDGVSKNCILIVQVNVPPGLSYSFENVIYRGFAGLERRVTASRKSLYLIAGSPAHITPAEEIDGPADDDYTHVDINPDQPGEWSPCGGGQMAWIATQTEVDNGGNDSRAGMITVDSIDTLLRWKNCD